MPTMADIPWKVGATERTVSGRTWRHGFRFSIQDFRGLPLLSISYETEKEAKQAESAIRKAIERAIRYSTASRSPRDADDRVGDRNSLGSRIALQQVDHTVWQREQIAALVVRANLTAPVTGERRLDRG